jgi:hypothetical protein
MASALDWVPLILVVGNDGNVPASSRIGMHLDLKPFFGEAISDHFR